MQAGEAHNMNLSVQNIVCPAQLPLQPRVAAKTWVSLSFHLVMAAVAAETWRSKLGSKYQKKDIEKWDSQLKSELAALRKLGPNKKCFDCGSCDTNWASPKLGIFICTTCSDVHRAAGAHITCVKNFSTYLWGPDEVEVMKAVGNSKGRSVYGDATVQPSDPKHHKVIACTRKYGCPRIAESIRALVASATEASCAGSMSKPLVQLPTSASIARNRACSAESQSNIVAKAKPIAASDTDWFDELFAQDGFVPAPVCVNELTAGEDSATGTKDRDNFLNMCSSSGPAVVATEKKQDLLGHGLDDLVFADFGNW
eukprot:TRINITY_DN924_c0_g1_i2.p1 TRINITY_DN924_c0_g1~~TRINITY_DN924_c0_g1_i2.p1  ORF type:complete len:312 (+),score=64.87 TRINITY_DN924_c0_g1_i2:117-1052(+)